MAAEIGGNQADHAAITAANDGWSRQLGIISGPLAMCIQQSLWLGAIGVLQADEQPPMAVLAGGDLDGSLQIPDSILRAALAGKHFAEQRPGVNILRLASQQVAKHRLGLSELTAG